MTSNAQNHAGNEYARRLAEQSRTPKEHRVDAKVYFHRHNYAKFHFDLGVSGSTKTIAFANYRYITDDKREQDQLDIVADAPGTMIYTMADSDVNAALEQELRGELQKDVIRTAQAQAASHGQQFDPNQPIVPVHSQPLTPTTVQVRPVTPGAQQAPQGVAVTGMQNTFSGTQATEQVGGAAVAVETPPTVQSEALARLAAMTESAKATK